MYKSFVAIALLGLGLSSAKANLGMTYQEACRLWGGPGKVDRVAKSMIWQKKGYEISEIFVKNHSVLIRAIPSDGQWYRPGWVEEKILPDNKGGYDGEWHRMENVNPDKYAASWYLDGGEVLAAIYPNGVMQITYRWYIKAKGLLDNPNDSSGSSGNGLDSDKAPMEDNGVDGSVSDNKDPLGVNKKALVSN
jgi:hypothetical protein